MKKYIYSEGLQAEICQAIRQERKAKGLSQADLGKQLDMMQRHISEIERGKVTPRLDTLLEILRILNLDLVLVPKKLALIIRNMVQDNQLNTHGMQKSPKDRPLYAVDDDEAEENNDN